jgi:response regulator RpfG family c-di-GMP phosphodiesterase
MDPASVSILIVDDEKTIRQSLREVVAAHGYGSSTAPNARAALKALQECRYELVIADINMPGEDGLWLLQKVREGYPDTAMIMLTGVGDVRTAVGCLKLGASDYVTKPFKIDDVLASIYNALERRRLVLENQTYQRSLEEMVRQRTGELNRALEDLELSYMSTLEALIAALDAREHETQNHSHRVQAYTMGIARAYGIPGDRLGDVARGSLLHDIGKIGVADRILNKPAKLTPEEWVDMRRHPEVGFQILKTIPYFDGATRIVRYHHERWDGKGYPYGLRADEIPVEARLFMVADTFDAMTSDRVYRKALPVQAAVDELDRCRGSQFDPGVVTCFLENMTRVVQEVSPHLVESPVEV